MTVEEYRAHPALNFSLAKQLLKLPAHYQAALHEKRKAPTSAMQIGTFAHAMILEGKTLGDLCAIKPEGMSFVTKDGKAWKAEQTLPIITEEEETDLNLMAHAVQDNVYARSLLTQCQHRETPIFATLHGVECKALLDCHGSNEDGEWVISDLKTCQDASPREFRRNIMNYHYDLQAAWYCSVLGKAKNLESSPFWTWIAVEKSAPYANAVYTAENWMESGMAKLETVLTEYKKCQASGKWPASYYGLIALEGPTKYV
jgi:hypothetical protein